ncbi:hypothetical protein UK12_07005 [Saccharothrix sp. ST-888]|nr:hypothetical protein UK12_07005 [Saccharothrix sp. ST-888]
MVSLSFSSSACSSTRSARPWLDGSLGIAIFPSSGIRSTLLCFSENSPSGATEVAPIGTVSVPLPALNWLRSARCWKALSSMSPAARALLGSA